MTDNKLIAEFMGVKPTILGDEITYEMYGAIDCIEDGLDEQHFFLEEELMFHTEWNWLMPVAWKINRDERYIGNEYRERLMDVVPYGHMGDIYEAVVGFIKTQNND